MGVGQNKVLVGIISLASADELNSMVGSQADWIFVIVPGKTFSASLPALDTTVIVGIVVGKESKMLIWTAWGV